MFAPFFDGTMKKKLPVLVVFLVIMTSCRTKSISIADVRRLDSVASLRSMSASSVERVEVWETVVMRPDSTGSLVAVSRDIVRHTTKEERSEETNDSTETHSTDSQSYEEKSKTTMAGGGVASRAGFCWYGVAIWLAFAGLACFLLNYLMKKWTLRN